MAKGSRSQGPYCVANMRALVGLLLQPGADPVALAKSRKHAPATVAVLAERAPVAADLALATDIRLPLPDDLRRMNAALDDARARLAVLRAAFVVLSSDDSGKVCIEAIKERSRMNQIKSLGGIAKGVLVSMEIVSDELHLLGEVISLPPAPPKLEDPAPAVNARKGPRPAVSDGELEAAILKLGHDHMPGYRQILHELGELGLVASALRVRVAIKRFKTVCVRRAQVRKAP